MAEAAAAWARLGRAPSPAAREAYNEAVRKLFDQLRCSSETWAKKAQMLGTALGPNRPLPLGFTLDDLETLVPASSVPLKGMGRRHADPGIGVPLVGWKSARTINERSFPFAPPTGIPLNLTAVLDFSSTPPAWHFLSNPKQTTISVGRRKEPLAVDWSASSGLYWHLSNLDDTNLIKVFLPSRLIDHDGLFLTSPYDPRKIPVVFVHGLNSSPGTFKRLYNHLVGQRWFRDHYQALFFSYPTGIGWPYNAAKFRRRLREAREYAATRGSLEQWDRMVVIGHSMGGVISRASLVDPGTRFYDASYNRPLEKLRVSASTRRAIESVRLYQPLLSPSRAIFMAAPHRGSPMADRGVIHWLSSLVRLPKTLTIDFATATLDEIGRAIQSHGKPRPPLTSFGTLSPTYKPYAAINQSPFRPGLVYHSIIGNRGKGERQGSSDGIVPYWSSHLPGAQSETMIPASHTLTGHPETIAEVSRILQLHLKKR